MKKLVLFALITNLFLNQNAIAQTFQGPAVVDQPITAGDCAVFTTTKSNHIKDVGPCPTNLSPFGGGSSSATVTHITGLSAGASSTVDFPVAQNTGGPLCVYDNNGIGSSSWCGTYDNLGNFVGAAFPTANHAVSSGSSNLSSITAGISGAGTLRLTTGAGTSTNNFSVTYWPSSR